MNRLAIAAVTALVAALTGCISAEDSADVPTTATTAPASADQRCDLVTSEQLQQLFGKEFTGPTPTSASNQQQAECQWTATDQAALVLVKISDGGGKFLYRENARAAEENIGAVQQVKVKGADSAYLLPRLGRVGMIVAGNYIEVTTLIPGATDEQIVQFAEVVASNAK